MACILQRMDLSCTQRLDLAIGALPMEYFRERGPFSNALVRTGMAKCLESGEFRSKDPECESVLAYALS